MPPVLRKRKEREVPPPPPAKKAAKGGKAAPKAKAEPKARAAPAKKAAPKKAAGGNAEDEMPFPAGSVIDLEGFGGEVETHDGDKVTLKQLVDESKGGVVLFTYPKASTPGCTKQVCFFRDDHEDLTKTGLAIYGLSADSGKANTTFRTKHDLPYPLLCDPASTLIGAIGLQKDPKGTRRGVFVVDKEGKVLVAEPGSPQGTVDVVKALIEGGEEEANGKEEEEEEEKEEKE